MVTKVIKYVYNQKAVGYLGQKKILRIVRNSFYQLLITADITRYIRNYYIYRRSKIPRNKLFGYLEPLPVPEERQANITMDFVTGLLLYQGMNAILSITDRLTKKRYYIPCYSGDDGTMAEEIANLLVREIQKLYSLP